MQDETGPLQIGETVIGLDEADAFPFENSLFDFSRINEYLAKNPAVLTHIVPDSIINSCSECCMESINGFPNILGRMFRKSRKDKGCSGCPVLMASEKLPARMADGSFVRDRNEKILSEADVVRIAEDGEK